jgi:hypothetical protein
VNGKEIGGFDLSAASLHDPGARRRLAEDHGGETADPAARYEILSQARRVPGQAAVKVSKDRLLRAHRQELRLQLRARHDG